MVITKLDETALLPLMDNKVIFYDVPENFSAQDVLEVLRQRKCEVYGVLDEAGKPKALCWSFSDVKKVLPNAKEFGNWHRRDAKDIVGKFMLKMFEILFADGTQEIFGFSLAINAGERKYGERLGGKAYQNITRFKCWDGRTRDLHLGVVVKSELYKLKDGYKPYTLQEYLAVAPR